MSTRQRKLTFILLLFGMIFSPFIKMNANPNVSIKGRWKSAGRTSNNKFYVGNLNIIHKDGAYLVKGMYFIISGDNEEQLFRFSVPAKFDGKNLTFSFHVIRLPGLLKTLSRLGEILETSNKVIIHASYQLYNHNKGFMGSWKADGYPLKGTEAWRKEPDQIEVTSIAPGEIIAGEPYYVLTISGLNFPDKSEWILTDFIFLRNSMIDLNINVKEILEVDDYGTSVKIKINLQKNIDIGSRDLKILNVYKANFVNIKKSQSPSYDLVRVGYLIRKGHRGKIVKDLQKRLKALGYKIPPTGYFGPITKRRLIEFQKDHNVNPTGNFGPLTLKAIEIAEKNLSSRRHGGGIAYRRGKNIGTIELIYIDGKPVEKKTAETYLRMYNDAKRSGVELKVISGFRTNAEQQVLYNAYFNGRGNLAAYPGYSNHQSGIALDLNTSSRGVYSWLRKNGKKYGFIRTVPSEKWHWEYRP